MSELEQGAGRVVVVTGASSGIGRALAHLLTDRGDRLVLAARRRDALEALAGELAAEVVVVPTDLASPADTEALIPATLEAFGRVDVLVNNAGYGVQTRFIDMGADAVRRMFEVNVVAPMALARAVVPTMQAQGAGSIINVASVGGVVAHPLNVAYCASKHALVGFSKALRLELKGTGVRVTAVCPAATRTEFFDVARRDIPFAAMLERSMVPPERVARVIVKAIERNQELVFPTLGARFLGLADKWLAPLSAAGNVRYRDSVLKADQPGRYDAD